MGDDDAPGFGVDFVIDGGESISQLAQLAAVMDSTEAKILADASRIEKATGGMIDTGRATAGIKTFAADATRDLGEVGKAKAMLDEVLGRAIKVSTIAPAATGQIAATTREIATTEKAIEQMIRTLDRETAATGRSREEQRAARIEELALTAARQGNSDAADRLFASSRALSAVRDAAGEAKHTAEINAAAEALRERELAERRVVLAMGERAQLESALQRNFGVDRPRATDAGASFSALAERERELELVEKRVEAEKAAALAQRQQILLLGERAQLEGALQRTMGADRPRATDAGASFSALAARAADEEARAQAAAAAAIQRTAQAHAELADRVRASQAAQLADADAAERLRASTDPLYAATQRLNAEIAESTRLYHVGATAPAEYARQQEVLAGRLRDVGQQHDQVTTSARRSGHAMTQLSFQANDVVTMALSGSGAMQIFGTQAGQVVQVFQQAEGGARGLAGELGGLALRFAPVIAGAGAAAAGLGLFVRWVNQGVTNDQLTRDLGKITGGANATKQELYKLRDETISFGDVSKALFSEVGKDIAETFVGDMKGMGQDVKAVLDDLTSYGKTALAGLYAGVAGTKAYLSEMEKGGVGAVWRELTSPGDPALMQRTYGAAYDQADAYLTKLGSRVRQAAVQNARERLAEKIGFNAEPKTRTDRHAEQLARQAEATEAQIRNLYSLAEAYRTSGAAALIAEARVKAESDAIKKRGDIEAMVDRQVRLSIAQRVADSAKGAAGLRDQAAAQVEANGLIMTGNASAERAAEIMRQRMADLPLLAAIEAAQQRGLTAEVEKATKALEEQRSAQADLDAAETGKRFVEADVAADKRLAELREELRLVGATDAARVHALATLKATQEADGMFGPGAFHDDYIAKQVAIADAQQALTDKQAAYNAELSWTADRWDMIAGNVQNAASGMADAFGDAGRAIGDMASIYAGYHADRARLDQQHTADLKKAGADQAQIDRANSRFALQSTTAEIGALGDAAAAAKGLFGEKTKGYAAVAAAEKAFRAVEFALSVRAMVQDAAETGSKLATSAARIATGATEAVVNAIKSLPFPLNLAAGAATIGALAGIGVSVAGSFGGGGGKATPSNSGTGTVLGDSSAQSDSLKRAIDSLKEVDTVTSTYAREMASSLRSIDSQIGSVAALVVRAGDINASAGVREGFASDTTGKLLSGIVTGGGLLSKVPVIGSIIGGVGSLLGSLFGSTTKVTASGLYGGPQSLGSILGGGFDASTFSDVEKTKKFLGIKTGTSTSTQFGQADAGLEQQFTLILRGFSDAIGAAAGPLGEATGAVEARLAGFVVNLGKVDLKGLTGEQIEEKLTAIFGAAADSMAGAAFPGVERFQKVGEGAFETLVRVASTVEAVTTSLDRLGAGARALGIDAKLGLAAQFDSVSDLTSAADAYFQAFYTREEQSAAQAAQLTRVFAGMGLVMPSTIAGFRQLVEVQDLTSASGQAAYATLLQLAPAFADLQSAMAGAKSAADIASERQDLERKLLELRGDTAALRAIELAKLDASNRGLQEQIYAVQDAQEAAKAAEQLREAWSSVGDSIMDEVRRIRGLTGADGSGSFAELLGRFNVANSAARGGDMDAAKSLPGLSQSLLKAAEDAATSRQELKRVQAATAASLEATYGVVGALTAAKPTSVTAQVIAAAEAQGTPSAVASEGVADALAEIRDEIAGMRRENAVGHATTASKASSIDKRLEAVTADSGGQAISVAAAA